MDGKLKKAAINLFSEECERINLLYKLQKIENKIENNKNFILQRLAYPDGVQVIDLDPLILRVVMSDDVEIYTKDQYEKIEGFLNE